MYIKAHKYVTLTTIYDYPSKYVQFGKRIRAQKKDAKFLHPSNVNLYEIFFMKPKNTIPLFYKKYNIKYRKYVLKPLTMKNAKISKSLLN